VPYENAYADSFFGGCQSQGLLKVPPPQVRRIQPPLIRNFSSLQTGQQQQPQAPSVSMIPNNAFFSCGGVPRINRNLIFLNYLILQKESSQIINTFGLLGVPMINRSPIEPLVI